jgi:hypothetical protein
VPALLDRLRRGERIEHYETVRVHKDGTRVDVSLSISPIKDAEGRIVGAAKIARDVTGRKRADKERALLLDREHEACAEAQTAERRASFLAGAGSILAASLDYETTLINLANLAAADVADWVNIDLLAADGSLQRLATAHIDPARVEMAHEWRRRYPPDPAPRAACPTSCAPAGRSCTRRSPTASWSSPSRTRSNSRWCGSWGCGRS